MDGAGECELAHILPEELYGKREARELLRRLCEHPFRCIDPEDLPSPPGHQEGERACATGDVHHRPPADPVHPDGRDQPGEYQRAEILPVALLPPVIIRGEIPVPGFHGG